MTTYHKEGDLCPRCKEGKLIPDNYTYELLNGEKVKVEVLICDGCRYEAEIIKTED